MGTSPKASLLSLFQGEAIINKFSSLTEGNILNAYVETVRRCELMIMA